MSDTHQTAVRRARAAFVVSRLFFGAVGLAVAAVLILLVVLLAQVRAQQQDNTARDANIAYVVKEVRCYLVPGQPCYKRDQASSAKTIATLTRIIAAADVCTTDPRIADNTTAVLRCVETSLTDGQQPSR